MRDTGREPVGWAELADAVPGGVAVQSGDTLVYVSETLASMVGVAPDSLLGEHWRTLFDEREAARFAREPLERVRADGEWEGTVRVGGEAIDDRPLELRLSRTDSGSVVWVATEGPRSRGGELDEQRDEFATLDRINGLLLETIQALVQTTSRDALERTITRRLTGSDLYAFAWVGEPELDGDRIVPRTHAGTERGYLEDIALPDEDGISGDGPAGRAVSTGEIRVANVDDPVFEPWRDQARARGFESLLAVPLQHGETVYGVLAVYATRDDVFTDRERTWFDTLGRTVGFAIHAAKNRELLFADSVVELEFDVTGSDTMLVETADELACRLRLDGYVAAGEQWVLYVDVEEAEPAAVVEAVSDTDRLDRSRVLGEGRIELTVSRSPLLDTVTAAGGSIRRVDISPDSARLLLEAPVSVDVRELVARLQAAFPETALLSRREPDHDPRRSVRPGDLLEDLTARQRDALEAAFHAGYFDWPRETTAEAVAESLDLAPPTLHGHLRKAEHTLLSEILD